MLQQNLEGNNQTDFYKADSVSFAILGGSYSNAEILIRDGKGDYTQNPEDGECVTWSFICALGNKKSFRAIQKLGYKPTDLEVFHAYENSDMETFQYLLHKDYSIYVQEDGDNILDSVCLDSPDKAWTFCKRGLYASESNLKSLIWIVKGDVVKKIIESKKTKGVVRKEELLQESINIGDLSMVKYFVENGANVNRYLYDKTKDYSYTSMHMASGRESSKIVSYLKRHGGDIH